MTEPTLKWLNERRVRIDGLQHPALKHPRPIYVHVPAQWREPGKTFPVLYCFDGESVLSKINGDTREGMDMDLALDRLIAVGAATPAFLVAIPNSQPQDRNNELGPTGTQQEQPALHLYITTVLEPFLGQNFPLGNGPENRGVVGFSMGGLSSFTYGWRFPQTYGLVGALSPSIQMRRDIIDQVIKGDGGPTGTRFWFGTGGHEFIERCWLIRDVMQGLIKRGWAPERDVQFALQYQGRHSERACAERMENMLGFLLAPQAPEPIGARVTPWELPDAELLDISAQGEGARALLRIDYPHNRFSHLLDAEWMDSEGLYHFDPADPGLPVPGAGDGRSRVSGRSLKWQADIPALWDAKKIPGFRMIPKHQGDPAQWQPAEWLDGAVAGSLQLAVAEHADGLLLAVRAPQQPGIVQLGIDTGSLHQLPLHRHLGDSDDFPKTILRAAAGFTPEQVKGQQGLIVGQIDGARASFLIPHAALTALDGETWDILRINAFARMGPADGKLSAWFMWKSAAQDLKWQPTWNSAENIVGSGIFIRKS